MAGLQAVHPASHLETVDPTTVAEHPEFAKPVGMIAFVFGGFAVMINAAYSMNAMVHNTAWVQGHFHIMLGTTVALSFMGPLRSRLPADSAIL